MKKKIGIALLAIILVSGLIYAVDQCVIYSTNPKNGESRGLHANLSGRIITVESSIKEPVKIIEVKIGTEDYTWKVDGTKKRIPTQGSTTLTIPGTNRLTGTVLIRAESCD
jgi:hypothetical protein